MTARRRIAARALAGLALVGLTACDLMAPVEPVLTPRARPPQVTAPESQETPEPSANSEALRAYYAQVLRDGQTRGLLRTDGGGPDTPYTVDMLVRNFEQISFFSEYERGEQPLRRWDGPVRLQARFGASASPALRTRDTNALIGYANRLARVTGHPISVSADQPNFLVFFVSEDERAGAIEEMRRIEPRLDGRTLASITNLPRSTYCLVVAMTDAGDAARYRRAFAIIRTEQPDLMRLSCIHEEVAQGLGLANDSPYARPSIFNDDDEFALLTSHDEKLLKLHYDPRLTTGMGAEQALPIARNIAADLMAPGS
ncbi:DUF2927 domain-containing protein [Aliishimia ponticola]|uniref:DUF2927 domain-containing protein n=1 Tax=Aliishimia ponticola TaxID=2499833 RepID=A0A4S4NJG4_9RHOB|nr:DUF2927 domain-containing protein [Aliishimia ponticola]THH36250.1 DUF2927 domain-containing protein [Aliishimia ponticola]